MRPFRRPAVLTGSPQQLAAYAAWHIASSNASLRKTLQAARAAPHPPRRSSTPVAPPPSPPPSPRSIAMYQQQQAMRHEAQQAAHLARCIADLTKTLRHKRTKRSCLHRYFLSRVELLEQYRLETQLLVQHRIKEGSMSTTARLMRGASQIVSGAPKHARDHQMLIYTLEPCVLQKQRERYTAVTEIVELWRLAGCNEHSIQLFAAQLPALMLVDRQNSQGQQVTQQQVELLLLETEYEVLKSSSAEEDRLISELEGQAASYKQQCLEAGAELELLYDSSGYYSLYESQVRTCHLVVVLQAEKGAAENTMLRVQQANPHNAAQVEQLQQHKESLKVCAHTLLAQLPQTAKQQQQQQAQQQQQQEEQAVLQRLRKISSSSGRLSHSSSCNGVGSLQRWGSAVSCPSSGAHPEAPKVFLFGGCTV